MGRRKTCKVPVCDPNPKRLTQRPKGDSKPPWGDDGAKIGSPRPPEDGLENSIQKETHSRQRKAVDDMRCDGT